MCEFGGARIGVCIDVCYGLNHVPVNSYAEVLTISISEYDLFGNGVTADIIKDEDILE